MPFNYSIRLANKKDTNKCVSLSKNSWPTWWKNNERLGKKHIEDGINGKRCLVAISNNKIIGFCIWGIIWNKIHLQDIFVKEKYRKEGIATKLVKTMEEIAKKRGFKEIVSDTDFNNLKAISFHLKNGFKKVGVIKSNWDDIDSYVFSRKL